MLADWLDYVVGVDPHRDEHAVGVVEVRSGVVVFETSVAADSDGYAEALRLAEMHAPGRRAFAVEGTGSYGAGLTRFLSGSGERVFEVGRLPRERRGAGKTDALDAVRAARSVLAQERPATPRNSGEREALRALMAAREGAVNAKRAGLCQLRDSPCHDTRAVAGRAASADPGKAPGAARCDAAARAGSDPELRGALLALRAVARRIKQLIVEERELAREIKTLTEKLAPQLLAQPGVGPLLAAQVVLSWSHKGRIRSEAAFARLAGVAPIPASSGQTIRYRLDRSSDRQLNRALHQILVTRRRAHPPRSPTSNDASAKARPAVRPTAASNATSPAASTGSSRTERHRTLDKHRSITGAGESRRFRRLRWLGGEVPRPRTATANPRARLPEVAARRANLTRSVVVSLDVSPTRSRCARHDSNVRPQPPQGCALSPELRAREG